MNKELVKSLEQWPDEAQIEIAIPTNPFSTEPMMEDKIWFEINMVEDINPDPVDDNMHGLLFAGKVTME